jgi:uncharacterized protein YjbI with pentapeptide repeats
MSGWRVRNVNLAGLRVEDANLAGASLSGCRMDGMTIDGIEVSDLLKVWAAQAKSEDDAVARPNVK